ncbi:TetR family transcriptional regulator [Frondihabitans australicus]|uniref:TetR family transcriptional regulator n=1 Tax=Frondihabitans australicus TaxID=386892 RepID=A0A495IJF9_9MICO|nr:TetR family transcriptional regulator [Frondihabitans australicus]RKR75919.1 TetR family transcriptional regulator [Frondihabitans australicus]
MSDERVTKRAAILSAATELFVEHGYAGASLRDIGRVADADASLVIHYFGSKEGLFLAAMRSVEGEHPLLDGPLDGLGERYIRFVLESGPSVRAGFLAVLRAGQTAKLSARMRELHETNFVEPLESRLTGADVELRARLAAALVGGLLYSFWIVGDEYLLAADHEAVIRRYGRLLQDLVDY